ncbi:hypothetical protein Pan216_04510 [Planctomycetes bacterium Pan216]|uniref:Uncharacterized protein n=1 Tax=Kolteria novifilia TaxID=2527975 RepID=A0A518AY52_9BACT|nr:hypothetical protein Pan216_04510 [Planctomycetes bacterium Pan216]
MSNKSFFGQEEFKSVSFEKNEEINGHFYLISFTSSFPEDISMPEDVKRSLETIEVAL